MVQNTKRNQPVPENPDTDQHRDASNVIEDDEKHLYGLWFYLCDQTSQDVETSL